MIPDLSQFFDENTIQLLVAAVLGTALGFERELARKDPSLRTFMLIAVGSCAFSIISSKSAPDPGHPNADPGRIAAQIVVGIGFLGAGTIFRSRDRVLGLTTAALMWVTAAIGTAVGFERMDLAVKCTIIVILFMTGLSQVHRMLGRFQDEDAPKPKNKLTAEKYLSN